MDYSHAELNACVAQSQHLPCIISKDNQYCLYGGVSTDAPT